LAFPFGILFGKFRKSRNINSETCELD
jgi:hypothetical protein